MSPFSFSEHKGSSNSLSSSYKHLCCNHSSSLCFMPPCIRLLLSSAPWQLKRSQFSFLMVALSKFLTYSLPPPMARALRDCQPCRRNSISCTSMYLWQALVEALWMCWRSQIYVLILPSLCVILHYCRWDCINFRDSTEVYPDSLSPWYEVWMKHRNKDTSATVLINYKALGINFALGSMPIVFKNFLKN